MAGRSWTSTISPSAPAATAASAMGSTSALLPAAWLGSTMTGRCVRLFSTGMADTSSAARAEVRLLRMPRSQSMTRSLPEVMMYSAASSSSSRVAAAPRLSSTGLPACPSARSSA